jgi:hypothetical protein
VVRAHERLALAARRGLDAGAAVAAHVEVGGEAAVAGAHDEQRHAGGVVREEVAGRRELRGVADRERQVAEQPLALPLEARRVGVRGDRDGRRRGRGIGRPVLDVGEHAADERGLEVSLHGDLATGARRRGAWGRWPRAPR